MAPKNLSSCRPKHPEPDVESVFQTFLTSRNQNFKILVFKSFPYLSIRKSARVCTIFYEAANIFFVKI